MEIKALVKHPIQEIKGSLTSFTTTTVKRAVEWLQRNGYYNVLGGYTDYSSYSGSEVTIDTSLQISAVYAAVKILGEDMGTLPFIVYERSSETRFW